jgi:3-oxoacyl-[acyl-carrier-protein] synthase II
VRQKTNRIREPLPSSNTTAQKTLRRRLIGLPEGACRAGPPGAFPLVGMMQEMGTLAGSADSDRGEAMSSAERRVVVTGLGAVTPLGSDIEMTWRRLIAGESAGAVITAFAPETHPVRIACEAVAFEPERWLERRTLRRLDRFAQFAVAAARMAEADAELDIGSEPDRMGAAIATAQGGVRSLAECCRELAQTGRIHPTLVTAFMPNMAAGWVSIELGLRGPLASPCTACAASAMAVGEGYDAIRLGRAEVMLCGGSEAGITPLAMAGFAAMRALSRRNDDPASASRPFDAGRDGFVMGEGAAVLVLEELGHARARGARVYAEVGGYGLSSDSFHMTEPDPAGTGQARAIRAALRDAGVAAQDVDYVNAHASSTELGDTTETVAIKAALGEEKARSTPISSIKGAIGHCLGAAGAVEAAVTVLALRENIAPPTINYENLDASCDLDYVSNEARPAELNIALSNSFGFGGHNAVLLLRSYEDGRATQNS